MASSGGSGSGSSGSYNKVGMLLLGGLGLAGLIIFLGGGDKDDPEPVVEATSAPTTVAAAPNVPVATRQTSQTNPQPSGVDKDALRLRDPNNVIVTVAAYGLPARVGITAQNDSEVKSRGVYVAGNANLACLPDAQYPNACVSYMVVPRGATVTVTAGDSRAGFWPVLDSLRGPGCEKAGNGDRDVSCTLTLAGDADFTATYYGDTTPSGRYVFPKCPVASERGSATTSPWIARCQ